MERTMRPERDMDAAVRSHCAVHPVGCGRSASVPLRFIVFWQPSVLSWQLAVYTSEDVEDLPKYEVQKGVLFAIGK